MFEDLFQQFKATQPEEWVAFSFAILQVVFAYLNKPINFLFGAISVCFYTVIYHNKELPAESILNAYYLVVSIYGLFLWNKKQGQEIVISKTNKRNWWITLLIIIACFITFICIYYFREVNFDIPFGAINYADALTAALAFGGTYLLLKRNIETWIVLNLSNLIAMPVQWSKGLYLTSVLTFILFSVAVAAWFKWRAALEASEKKTVT